MRNALAPGLAHPLVEIGYRVALCKGSALSHVPQAGRRKSGRLHVGEELAYFRFQTSGFDRNSVGKILNVGGS